jgi:hypothetical protein
MDGQACELGSFELTDIGDDARHTDIEFPSDFHAGDVNQSAVITVYPLCRAPVLNDTRIKPTLDVTIALLPYSCVLPVFKIPFQHRFAAIRVTTTKDDYSNRQVQVQVVEQRVPSSGHCNYSAWNLSPRLPPHWLQGRR